jgi:hypothetical protein
MATRKSRPLIHNKCPSGFIKRSGFTRKTNGKHIKSICVRGVSSKKKNGKSSKKSKLCGPGKILRSSYTRRILKKNGSVKETRVSATCVRDMGKAGKLSKGAPTIGPLKKGELQRFGYMYKLPEHVRHNSLRAAIKSLGSLNVYRKLDAVAKLTNLTSPKASATFAADRDWIRSKYVLL